MDARRPSGDGKWFCNIRLPGLPSASATKKPFKRLRGIYPPKTYIDRIRDLEGTGIGRATTVTKSPEPLSGVWGFKVQGQSGPGVQF